MESTFYNQFMEQYAGLSMISFFVLLIGAIGAAKLFAKCDRPWLAAFIPVWNLMELMTIVGRPKIHVAFFLIPLYNIYFFFRVCIELAQSFGKYTVVDYILVCVFNIFYVLNLALAYNEEYHGPVYGKSARELNESRPALV